MKLKRNFSKNQSGQSLVEFALILPILLALIIGLMDFGWLIMARISVNNAAREVARHYVVDTSEESSAKERGQELMNHISFLNGPVILISKEGDKATVTINGHIKPIIGIFVKYPDTTDIVTTAHMKIEN